MNAMPKVLVVDSGERAPDGALSAELAGMGYASVTTPFEAADDVLALIPSPAAVVLQMPRHADWAERKRFLPQLLFIDGHNAYALAHEPARQVGQRSNELR